jgi:hypothetical protein
LQIALEKVQSNFQRFSPKPRWMPVCRPVVTLITRRAYPAEFRTQMIEAFSSVITRGTTAHGDSGGREPAGQAVSTMTTRLILRRETTFDIAS